MKSDPDETGDASPKRPRKVVPPSAPPTLEEGSCKCLEVDEGYTISHKGGYKPWKLNGYTPTGSRVRDSFKTLIEAASERKSQIRRDLELPERTQLIEAAISQQEAEDAEQALKILKTVKPPGWGEDKRSLTGAAQFMKENYRPCSNPKDAGEAIDAFLAAKEKANLRDASMHSWRTRLGWLRASLVGRKIHEAKPEDITPLILRGKCDNTYKQYWGSYNYFFKWCAKAPRHYTSYNPCSEINLEQDEAIEDESPVVIFPNPHVRSLIFDALTFKGGRMFLYFIDGIFEAIRPSEMVRCQARFKMFGEHWAHFGDTEVENYIEVIGKVRTRRTRPVRMYPALAKLKKRFVDAGYPLVPAGWYNDRNILLARNGYLGNELHLPLHIDREGLIPVVRQQMKHTGTTHKLNDCKSEGETGVWAGDTANTIYKHYKGKATEKETRDFLLILDALLEVLPSLEELIRQGVPEMITDSECAAVFCPVDKPNTFSLKRKDYDAKRAAYLREHPEAAHLKEPEHRSRNNFYTKRVEIVRHFSKDRKEQIRILWSTTRKELSINLGVSVNVCDEIFGDDLQLPLPSHKLTVWRAGGMNRYDLPLEVQEAFPDGFPPLSNDRKYIPLPELLKLAWNIPRQKWPEEMGFGIVAIQNRLRGLPAPNNIKWYEKPEMPDEIKSLVAMSEFELFEVARMNRGDENDWSIEMVDEVPPKITLPRLLKRTWEVPRKLIRQQWRMSRRVMATMLNMLPTPPKRYWSLFQTRRAMPDEVKKLIEMTDEELRTWQREKYREKYPPHLYGAKRARQEPTSPPSDSVQSKNGPEKSPT